MTCKPFSQENRVRRERRAHIPSPAVVYSYSWAANSRWTTLHPSGQEILNYLHNVCRKFKILDNIQTSTNVASVQWLDDEEQWELVLEHLAPGVGDKTSAERKALDESLGADKTCLRKERIRAKVVVSAAGGLVEPKPLPKVPGMETFKGDIVHTARWDHNVQIQDKNVVVVGSGCTGAQVTPEIVKPPYNARSVVQIIRTPSWIVPFGIHQIQDWWEAYTPFLFTWVPGTQWLVRKLGFLTMEMDFFSHFGGSAKASRNRAARQKELIEFIHSTVPEKYWEMVTPNFEFGCKRRVNDNGYYSSLQDPRIEVTTQPLTLIHENSIQLGPGRNYPPESDTNSKVPITARTVPCDVLVFATGYTAGDWLHPLEVRGRKGVSLHEEWKARGGAQAYMGVAMDGFPNFFIIFGPNTATGHSSVILMSENVVNYTIRFIRSILNKEVSVYEVKESAERKWTANVQKALKSTVFMAGGCKSWYFTEEDDQQSKSSHGKQDNRWNATTYPWSQMHYSLRCMFPYWSDWNIQYTARGVFWRIMRWGFFAAMFLPLVWELGKHLIRKDLSRT